MKEQCEQAYNKLLVLIETIDLPNSREIKKEVRINKDKEKNYSENYFHFKSLQDIKDEMNEDENDFQPKLYKKMPPKNYECYICSKSYLFKQILLNHMSTKHNFKKDNFFKIQLNDDKTKSYKCDQCDKIYTHLANLNRHYRKTHDKNETKIDVPCEKCGKLFSSKTSQQRHIRNVHLQEKPFVCEMCCKRFSQMTILQTHMLTHTKIRNFKCDQCGKAFKSRTAVSLHKYVHLPKDEQSSAKYSYRKKKKNKLSSTTTVHICEICGKSMTKQKMYYHIRKHHDGIQKIFECTLCLKKFVTKSELNIHGRVHSNERPYQCDLCSKAFRQNSHLLEHRKIHTGAKPHKCRFCEKSFAIRGNLREHERIHTGETPYSCNFCPLKFSNSKAIRRHAKNIHPENEEAAVTVKTRIKY